LIDRYALEAVSFLFSVVFLGYSAWSDLKMREVTDRVWVIYLPLAVVIMCLRMVLAPYLLTTSIVSVLVMFCLSFLMFYLGLFGGADAKALICLSIALPTYPSLLNPLLTSINPLFPLVVLYNSYLFSLSAVIYVVIRNLSWKYRTRKGLFENYEETALSAKIVAFLTGYKTNFKILKEKVYLYPMEEPSRSNHGFPRRLRLFSSANADRDDLVRNLGNCLKNNEEVWVSPGIPLLLFILMGLVSTTIMGDVLLWLAIRATSIVIGW
jgi:preflagellin peptidase FlaK